MKGKSKKISFSWILMWSIAYIACSILKPDLVNNLGTNATMIFFLSFGSIMLVSLVFNKKSILFMCGIGEVIAGVASWVGVVQWNVPWTYGYDPLAQISMAALDLVSAVFMFFYSFEIVEKYCITKDFLPLPLT